MKPYKIAVVGPIPRDTISTYKNEIIKKYGCVTHPTIALSKLLAGRGEVIPISHIHKMDVKAIHTLFKSYDNINLNGVYNDKDQGTIINLNFIDQNNRLEQQIANMCPIMPEDVAPFLDANSFVFVPITNFEIELDTLKFIKKNSEATIIFDAHGPTTFVNKNGKRLRQYWKDKDLWFPFIDILKMNLEESLCCWFDRDYTNEDFYNEDRTDHLDDFAKYVISQGVHILYVTLDSRGCVVYTDESDGFEKQFVASVPVQDVIDTTGCGDSFAGGLAYGFTLYKDPVKAAQYANILGALRTQGKDFDVFKSTQETETILKETYNV